MRAAFVTLPLLAGCQLVFPLDGPGEKTTLQHDEDGDGIPDVDDLCPHVNGAAQADGDKDGIGDECDPFPIDGSDEHHFFAFQDGLFDPTVLDDTLGDFASKPDALVMGAVDGGEQWLLSVDPILATAYDLEFGFQIVEPNPDAGYHEAGLVISHVTEDTGGRGRICVAGYDPQATAYLDTVENNGTPDRRVPEGTMFATIARLHLTRTANLGTCRLQLDGAGSASLNFADTYTDAGRIGLTSAFARVHIRYLWIYIHRGV
ncbi:MAG TPA: hypothetical protein VFQ53_16760 [Kofleriaceae bacterium]|nr:hypothetical protein [Kofleriaceae bacterium]